MVSTLVEYQAPAGAVVHTVRCDADAAAFDAWLSGTRRIAVDTETSGLDVFSPGWELRLVQLADAQRAWVFEAGGGYDDVWRTALEGRPLTFHNATYDLLALDSLHLYKNSMDTATLSQLADPAGKHGLKHLASEILRADSSDGEKRLAAHFRSNGWKKDEGWAKVDLRNEDYVTYAGLDAVLTARLFPILRDRVRRAGVTGLVEFERQIAYLMAVLTQRGIRVDVDYACSLREDLERRQADSRRNAILMGVENPGSPDQVREALLLDGVKLHKKTGTGKYSVSEEVLAAVDHPLAQEVLNMRRAAKFNASYVEGTLDVLGYDGRSHPWIRSLGARTGRMSVNRPPLHQLPSGDSEIRSLFIAEPGYLVGASDYANVELRVMAALAKEKAMLQAFANGQDLHQITADAAGVERSVGKMANFLTAYGGGKTALSTQAHISPAEAERVLAAFNRTFPGIKRWSESLQRMATSDGYAVRTPSGRRLTLDRDRVYAAMNYVVQSTARDILCQAILNVEAAGLFDYVLMTIHDELLWQAPEEEAEDVAKAMGEAMSMDFYGIELLVDSEVYGRSWGDGYKQKVSA